MNEAVEAVARAIYEANGACWDQVTPVARKNMMPRAEAALAAINWSDTLAELERLRAENERYREALEEIVRPGAYGWQERDIARKALDQPTERPPAEVIVTIPIPEGGLQAGDVIHWLGGSQATVERPQTIPGEEWSQAPQEES